MPPSLALDDIKLLVFDLDGTLIDSRLDLCNSVNATLGYFSRPPLPEEVISSYIGNGAAMLVRRALGDPEDEALLKEAIGFFMAYYREHKLDYTITYPGVQESVATFAQLAQAPRMAVLTNKPVNPAIALCDAFELSQYFFRIWGGDSFTTKKPDPQGLHALMHEAGVTPRQTVMIGDSDVDILTARNAGAWSIGCSFGLSPHTLKDVQPDIMVDSAADWVSALRAGIFG